MPHTTKGGNSVSKVRRWVSREKKRVWGGELTNWHGSNHAIIQFLIIFFISSRSDVNQSPFDIVLQRRDAFEGDLEDVRVFELCFCVQDFDALEVDDGHLALLLAVL